MDLKDLANEERGTKAASARPPATAATAEPATKPSWPAGPKGVKWLVLESRLLDNEQILMVFEKKHLKEARRVHPGKVIYFPPEIEELRRHKDSPDCPEFLKNIHLVKKKFGGWIVPSDPKGGDSMKPRNAESKPVFDVSEVKIRLVDAGTDGLIGWASCVVNGALYLNNIVIRQSRNGEFVLAYPYKHSHSDQKYFYFNPITLEATRVLDKAILGRLEQRERLTFSDQYSKK